MILEDLRHMKQQLATQFAEMPDPETTSGPWVDLIKKFPVEWKQLTNMLADSTSTCSSRSKVPSAPGTAPTLDAYGCEDCHMCFACHKALEQHRRMVHNTRSVWKTFIGNDRACPCCSKQFSTRLWAIAHLADPRRNLQCRKFCMNGKASIISDNLMERLDEQDRVARSSARKVGLTQPLSAGLPLKGPP